MAFIQVNTGGYMQRLMGSFAGVLLGIVLFFGSFAVFYWNEGRVDLSDIAEKAEIISSQSAAIENNGKFVSVSDTVIATNDVGDGKYLKNGSYLSVKREAEMYAWVEESVSTTETRTGGSQTTTTTYEYKNSWLSTIPNSSEFEYPAEHENPPQTQETTTYRSPDIMVGVYAVDGNTIDLPSETELALSEALVNLPSDTTLHGNYLYLNGADPLAPKVGDERIFFSVLHEGFSGTVFGEVSASKIVKYTDEDGNTLFRIFEGGHTEALATMHGEYSMMLWIMRLVGFFMMWFGMQAIIAPLSVFLDILPFLGGASRAVVGGVTFLIALVLSAVTIVVSAILHSIVALIIVAALVIGGIMFLRSRKKVAVSAPRKK